MWPHQAAELLFFAVFGQTTHSELKIKQNQSKWTSLSKLAFAGFMLVAVIVLINMLIAMMSDTYQRIQAQSDIEWKYGLSKLIRSMHRTTTAPSPLNLLTPWIVSFTKQCQQCTATKKRSSLVHMTGLQRGRMSPRSIMGAKWLSIVEKGQIRPNKENVTSSVVHLNPLGSQLSLNSATRIENVVDWNLIRKKYVSLMSNEPEKESEDDKENEDERVDDNQTARNGTNSYGNPSGQYANPLI